MGGRNIRKRGEKSEEKRRGRERKEIKGGGDGRGGKGRKREGRRGEEGRGEEGRGGDGREPEARGGEVKSANVNGRWEKIDVHVYIRKIKKGMMIGGRRKGDRRKERYRRSRKSGMGRI